MAHGASVEVGDPVFETLRKREREPVRVDALRLLLEAGAPISADTETWTETWFGCGEPSLLLVRAGLEVTEDRLRDTMWMCDAETFEEIASKASPKTKRRTWLRARKSPNRPALWAWRRESRSGGE